ncbi:MAG: hypothetical protein L3J65_12370 [Robiginitomaculum sp.]|nr:hypothetical protein [Robiginitomaculum sp.]
MIRLVKVVGDSMSPTLSGGDYIVTIKPRLLQSGFIYVVNHSDLGQIVKRLERIEDGRYYFAGDNPKSTPDAVIGPVPRERIAGYAILAISNLGVKKLTKHSKDPKV